MCLIILILCFYIFRFSNIYFLFTLYILDLYIVGNAAIKLVFLEKIHS